MNEAPHLLKPSRHFSGQSPTRNRLGDDILANLSPATAVEILSEPSGALKICMDAASAAEQDFATRTALASRTIWEWVEELSDWNWPSESGPAGFETPNGKQRKLSIQVTRPEGEEDNYLGSLAAQDVARYEARIAHIHRALDDLAVEEIKSHVLTNHIWPLSRPSTPMSDSNQSRLSTASSYTKMEDLTAVITAIVMQTLPNLARLSRLLQVWSTRLRVLKQVPGLLLAIEDAEMAIKSGWNAISQRGRPRQGRKGAGSDDTNEVTLSRDGFNVMKLILDKKVSNTGRALDYMLDSLEGLPDTLPNSWLDRMEAAERDYGDWVAACERILREAEWAKANRSRQQERSPSRQKKTSEEKPARRAPGVDGDSAVLLPVPKARRGVEEPSKQKRDLTVTPTTAAATLAKNPNQKSLQMSMSQEPTMPSHVENLVEPVKSSYDGTNDNMGSSPPCTPSPEPVDRTRQTDGADSDDSDYSTDREPGLVLDEDHMDLPPLNNGVRRDSNTSEETTVLHGASSHFDGMSSDLPEVSASPAIARSRIREAEYIEVSPVSPPSSPPLPPTDAASSSFTAPDSPWIPPIQEEDETASVDGSYLDDYDDTLSVSEITGPTSRRESTSDQQLRQQISEIIERIPAKIKLSSEPPKINLNPPDLQLPRLRKMPSREPFKRSNSSMSSHDPYRRSNSSMSSRAGTPSFTLSPAKNVRVRHQRSQQEIKVYHLSRSTGEAPIKLFIRCVGEHGERVMVRVGGGWADLSEYLKEYASHHGRRSAGADKAKVEVRDVPRVPSGVGSNIGSSPSSRPASALDVSPSTPLAVRKTRKSVGAASGDVPRLQPKTPAVAKRATDTAPSSEDSTHSRPSSRLSWVEDDSSFLGLAGPTGKKVEMSAENKAWVESVKQKVRLASGERKVSGTDDRSRFGELGKVGGTKRLFPKAEERRDMKR
ncbi:hypothetical protein HJFPF1_11232 [Paramyrothecium foliicola]|nr:hypothetical protein HJFPF1_11232 [Paramyrothecium foliicola]